MAGGYDWHVNDEIDFSARGIYSGNLVRDASVNWIKEQQESTKPFFLYVPFQECHSPFQVDQMYKDLYPQLANSTVRQTLAGMVTHTDEMIGDIITALRATTQWNNTLVVFSADNGTRYTMHPLMVPRCKRCIHIHRFTLWRCYPCVCVRYVSLGGPGDPETEDFGKRLLPNRFDANVIERNWPYRGQKHEIFEGGCRVAGWINGGLLPPELRGTTSSALIHVTDFLPTFANLAGGLALPTLPLDGVDQWDCLTKGFKHCTRTEMVYNIDLVCDTGPVASLRTASYLARMSELRGWGLNCTSELHTLCGSERSYHDCTPCLLNNTDALTTAGCTAEQLSQYCAGNHNGYDTECPAPKAALRTSAGMKLLVECYDLSTKSFTGRRLLYNLTSDPAESNDLYGGSGPSANSLDLLAQSMEETLLAYTNGSRGAVAYPMLHTPPWQGMPDGRTEYYCSQCPSGAPVGPGSSWLPWCDSGYDEPCGQPSNPLIGR
jgi:hypothetical protein